MEASASEDTRRVSNVVTLADIAEPSPVVDAGVPVSEVDDLFRRDLTVPGVVVHDARGPRLLTRSHLARELTGRFGYGRSLHARSVVGDLVPGGQVTLDLTAPLLEAALALLGAPAHERPEYVLAADGSGNHGVVAVARLFEHASSAFRDIAMTDPLTGLPNRRMLDERAGQLLAHGVDRMRVAMLYVDLDGFKQVNDTLGHQAGDELLVQFARRLGRCVRRGDLVARLGGDEFAVLLVDVDEAHAVAMADLVVRSASAAFVICDLPVHVTASVGLALAGEVPTESTLTSLDVLLRQADDAMLHAKEAGRSQVARLGSGGAGARPARHAAIRRRLREAIVAERFELHFQPKLDLATGKVRSVEALIRWTDDELGPVPPAEFIPVAERSGQIVPLGRWVVGAALAQARRWLVDGLDLSVAINVSAVQLAHTDVAGEVLAALSQHAFPACRLVVEVTEGVAVADLRRANAQLRSLETAGVCIHLDDFGTGYSSLSMLRDLPITGLKIDRSIVARVDTHAPEKLLLAGVVNAAHAMGLWVIAEGVERTEQATHLLELGVDAAQGFLVGRPVPAADVPALVRRIELRGSDRFSPWRATVASA